MLGRDYETLEEFKEACARRRGALDPVNVLSRIYYIAQLRDVCAFLGMETPEIPDGASGMERTYTVAEAIAGESDAESIGAALSRKDHDFYFPVLTYFRFSEGEMYSSVQGLFGHLGRQHNFSASEQYHAFFNGLLQPPAGSCQLESIYAPDMAGDTVSLVFSCCRCLKVRYGSQDTHRDLFLARIPVIARVLFRYRLIEVSMPTFRESPSFAEGRSPLVPYRYQSVFWSARAGLIGLLPFRLNTIEFPRLTLYLESRERAQDMGWMIEPQDDAELDLKQNLIPLKQVFDQFSETLREEATRRGQPHPLAGTDLYTLFRALREESYTSLFVLSAPLGPRDGRVLMQVLYGRPGTQRDPILLVQNYGDNVADRLRQVVNRSQITDVENPYDLDALFSEG